LQGSGPAGAGLRPRRPAARGPLRCSGFGRAAELATFTSFTALKHLRRVSSRSAWVHAPTEPLRARCETQRALGPSKPAQAGLEPRPSLSPSPTQPGTGRPQALRETTGRGERVLASRGHRARGLPRAAGALLGREPGSMPGSSPSLNKELTLLRKAVGRWAVARLCGGEARRGSVGARNRALRELTRRGCPSATNAVSEASSAARPKPEHRSEVGAPLAPTAAVARHRPPAHGFARAASHWSDCNEAL
jgi:hypothetical protein